MFDGWLRGDFFHASHMRQHIDAVHTLLVLSQMIALDESFTAKIASIAFASMAAKVCLQIVALRKALRALRTLVRSFARVNSHMDDQIIGALEALSAHRTQMPLLSGMISLVHFEIGGSRKTFAAIIAFVWLFAIVASHVHHQVIVSDKCHTTFGAKKLFFISMSFPMFTQHLA